ncbi:MAG: sulfotransferase [Nitrospinaceae bacterium]|nr:sulfotransferase [Nitrospinaceae bacterium]NIR56666.1 sulfotransferase [Nitrospinaceae bacterium]NIS87129.1 sulfotransferase [Nitrospinaceae bacterium]NIT83983.1 sulfotransferase [Nitrospinaceae bacterium]NIU46173.1 sulfotransferase [Nitrospinaceae bacterium]
MSNAPKKKSAEFAVAPWLHTVGGWVFNHREFWIRMGRWESKWLAGDLEAIEIRQPVYVTGLVRSGSTLLLEILEKHPDTATHRYKDFPFLDIPYWWNGLLKYIEKKEKVAVERAHKDRIQITPESPESMEEIVWMGFFDHLHDPRVSNVLDETTGRPEFEEYYKSHIQKLLLSRKARRFLSKANYMGTRLKYVQKMFPDARFIIPIREPVMQIASIIKQHKIFCEGQTRNPEAREHLRRLGHFEFGLDRRVINCGDTKAALEIQRLLDGGEEVRGLARYWNMIYGYLHDQREASAELNSATVVLRYEDLCADPEKVLTEMLRHTGLAMNRELIDRYKDQISPPTYYQAGFSDAELEIIAAETRSTRAQYGYPD